MRTLFVYVDATETVALRAGFFCVLRNSMQPVWLIGKLYRTEVPKCNRKLYSPVVSCTHGRKTIAGRIQFFVVLRIGYDSILVFYLVFICVGFTCTGKSSLGKSLCGKIKNPRKAGILGRYLAGRYTAPIGCELPQIGAFLAATRAVCRSAAEWCLCTTY